MAVACAPYLHPRLNAVGITTQNGQTVNEINVLQIYAVPCGATLDVKEGRVTIEGDPVKELASVEPYSGTPALELTDQSPSASPSPSVEPPLPVTEVDTHNVTRIDFKRDRDGEPG